MFGAKTQLTVRTRLSLLQASLRNMIVHDSLLATVTSVRTDIVLGTLATTDTILMAMLALAVVIVLRRWTFWNAERTVPNVFTLVAVFRVWTRASAVALLVTSFAGSRFGLVNSAINICDSLDTRMVILAASRMRPLLEIEH